MPARTQWVATSVLAPEEAEVRLQRFKLWVNTAASCVKLGSFNVTFAITNGLHHRLVTDSAPTGGLSSEERKEMGRLAQICSPDSDSHHPSFAHYHSAYKARLASDDGGPVLPVVPLLLEKIVDGQQKEARKQEKEQEQRLKLVDEGARAAKKEEAMAVYKDIFHKVIDELPDRETTKQGSKRRELADMRQRMKVVVDELDAETEATHPLYGSRDPASVARCAPRRYRLFTPESQWQSRGEMAHLAGVLLLTLARIVFQAISGAAGADREEH